MALTTGKDVVRTALLALWGMATLILFFAVVFLVYAMIERGQDPLDVEALDAAPPPKAQSDTEVSRVTKEVQLYFVNEEGTGLAPQTRRIEFTDYTTDNCREALEALIEGPHPRLNPVVAPSTRIRGLYLLDNGELVVDFSRDLESGMTGVKSAWAETVMVRAIVASLAQPGLRGSEDRAVRRVRFIIEGAPPEDAFPAHLDLSEPFAVDSDWFRQAAEGASDG